MRDRNQGASTIERTGTPLPLGRAANRPRSDRAGVLHRPVNGTFVIELVDAMRDSISPPGWETATDGRHCEDSHDGVKSSIDEPEAECGGGFG